MLIIGLTGGIGSGKSTVATLFESLNVPVIDADVVSRQVVEPGQPALNQIIELFGSQILDSAGRLDRTALRELIFSDKRQRQALETILHPCIMEEMRHQAATLKGGYCIFVIPLLFEAKLEDSVDRILVIDCGDDTRRQRVIARDKISAEQVDAIMACQSSRQEKLAQADDIIINENNQDTLQSQVTALNDRYKLLAR